MSEIKYKRILLKAMMRGFVTPITARDIAEDWLLR